MTKDEAINALGNFRRYISGGGAMDRKANEAISMAIEALKETHDKRTETHSCDCDRKETHGDVISRQDAEEAICDNCDAWYVDGVKEKCRHYPCLGIEVIRNLPSAEPEWNNHTVACLLAEMFGDDCACNFNGIDEWLPEKCEVIDSCPNPVGVACWEQFLKHRSERRTDE